jgi:hypothetical protein
VTAGDDAERSDEVGARPLGAQRLGGPPPACGGERRRITELVVLQVVRLKGRVSRADLAGTLGEDPGAVVDDLAGRGYCSTARRYGSAPKAASASTSC